MTAQPTNPNPRRNPGDEMLTLQEACAFLRVPEGTLRYWRHLGTGPRSFKVGRHIRLAHRPHPLAHRADQPPTGPVSRPEPSARKRMMKTSRKG
jgi:hypothetical protein